MAVGPIGRWRGHAALSTKACMDGRRSAPAAAVRLQRKPTRTRPVQCGRRPAAIGPLAQPARSGRTLPAGRMTSGMHEENLMTASIAQTADRPRRRHRPQRGSDARDDRAGARGDPLGHLRPGAGRRPVAHHHPGRRPRPARRRAGPRQDQARRDPRHRARPRRPPRPVHARPDALRHPRLRDPRRGRRPAPLLPLRARARSSPSS